MSGRLSDTQMRALPGAIIGKCHAITFETRGLKDSHIVVVLWYEDDETWYRTTSYSSGWHAELAQLMEQADRVLKSSKPDPSGYGFIGTPGKHRRKSKN